MLGFSALAETPIAAIPVVGSSGSYTLYCNHGAYTYTGKASSLIVTGRSLSASSGSYSISGKQASLKYTRRLSSSSGSYSITGKNSDLLKSYVLNCSGGSYSYTGKNSYLLKGSMLSGGGGAYSIAGSDANLIYSQPDQQVQTKGGFGKKHIKKSQTNEVESIVRKAFNKLEGIDDDIVSSVKSEIKQSKPIILTDYDFELDRIKSIELITKNRIKFLDELIAEDEDEVALLMLL